MKKLTAFFLALMMLALPVLAMAASPTELLDEAVDAGRPLHVEVSFEGGDWPLDESIASVINDMFNALSFRVDVQKGDAPQTDLAMGLSGTDVLTFSVAEADDLAYVQSNLLGSDVYAFTAGEGAIVLERLMQLMVDSGILTEDDLQTALEQIHAVTEEASDTMMDILNGFDVDDSDMEALIEWITPIMERATMEEVTAQPKDSDPAVTVINFDLTGEEIARLYEMLFELLKGNEALMEQLTEANTAMNGTPTTGEEAMDEMIALMNTACASIVDSVPAVIYLDENDVPVKAGISMAIREDEDSDDVVAVAIDYVRLTLSEGVTYSVSVVANENGDEGDGVSMTVNVLRGEKRSSFDFAAAEIEDGVTHAPAISVSTALDKDRTDTSAKDQLTIAFSIVDDDSGEEIGMTVIADIDAEKTGEDATLAAAIKLYLTGLENELLTMKVDASTGNAAASIVTEDTVRPGQMDDDEFNALLGQVMQNMQVALMGMLQALPASVLQMMN